MIHGLLWFPLLGAFIWLAWQGSEEYKKVEAYRIWAPEFERAKYDIYSVIGQKDNNITWGKPTSKGLINLKTFSLDDVEEIHLIVDEKQIELQNLPTKGRNISLEFIFSNEDKLLRVPFTEIPLAAEWGKFLISKIQN
jgi:hypothetical protein